MAAPLFHIESEYLSRQGQPLRPICRRTIPSRYIIPSDAAYRLRVKYDKVTGRANVTYDGEPRLKRLV